MTTLYAVLLGCLRKSISRILVLIVSMGFGVVLPYLGAIQHKVCKRQFDLHRCGSAVQGKGIAFLVLLTLFMSLSVVMPTGD